MSLVNKVIRRIKIEVSRRVGPVMIDGFNLKAGGKLKHVRYGSTTYFQSKEDIEMGDHVYIAHHCFIDASRGLKIGEGTQVCSYVSLLTHSSHNAIRLYGQHYPQSNMKGLVTGSVQIGAYTFIGPHAVIMPNSKIGKGSLVAAFAYVQGDFPEFSVISGNPAKVIGDTRNLDKRTLRDNPELIRFYNEWAQPEAEGTIPK